MIDSKEHSLEYSLNWACRRVVGIKIQIQTMSTLETLGLKLSDPVTSLFQQLADRQPSEDNKAACARIGADLQNDWCCVNIACLKNPHLTSDDMIGVIESNGGKRTWLKSIQFIIGHFFPPTGLGTGVPPSAALARSREMPSSEQQMPIISAQVDPGAATAMPMGRILSVIKDTRGVATSLMPACLSYTDTKAVMREVYVWQATQTGTVACCKSGGLLQDQTPPLAARRPTTKMRAPGARH